MTLLWKVTDAAMTIGRRGAARARSALETRRIERFERAGAAPWAPGYLDARNVFLARIVRDEQLRARLTPGATNRALPEGHGVGFDERAVEIPWILARWRSRHGRALDAGSALNHPVILDAIEDLSALSIVTLKPEGFADWRRGVSYHYADLRELPFRDAWFDRIACVSTLEHVGMDNRLFGDTRAKTAAPLDAMKQALRELWRVLAPGGELCVSVPFGRFEDHGAFLVFDEATLAEICAALPVAVDVERFRYGPSGWRRAEVGACADCAYVAWVAEAFRTGRFPDPVPVEPDRASAARAVACVSAIKPRA